MKKIKITGFILLTTLFTTGPLGGFEPASSSFALVIPPVHVSIPSSVAPASGKPVDMTIETYGPDGKRHLVRAMDGRRNWTLDSNRPDSFRLMPGADNYAGPVQVLINGRVVDRYNPALPGSESLLIEKVLVARMNDGAAIRVHYTDFSLERIGNPSFPFKVMTIAAKAYQLVTGDLGYSGAGEREAIDLYLGECAEKGVQAFGGFTREDFQRAPLFMLKDDAATGKKTPAILIPVDYGRFLSIWERINRVPFDDAHDEGEECANNHDIDLAGSIMHEMTHAILHSYHQNLGSTEHCIRNGDWYTEGLARYYETKIGSDSGFASEGFRKKIGEKVQFSRGGANYFLRYPDESFFGLRYENALFWLYFEKQFGPARLVALTERFRGISFEAGPADYKAALAETTGVPFDDMITEYFNWVYRTGYREYPESSRLLKVARTTSVWADGVFRLRNGSRIWPERLPKLDRDWVAKWGADRSHGPDEMIAGDWTPQADVKPLAFDVQEIRLDGARMPKKLLIRSASGSQNLRATVYAGHPGGIEMVRWPTAGSMELNFAVLPPDVQTIAVVLVNLDESQSANYEIVLE